MAMLSYCITASLRDGSDTDLRALLTHRLFDPLGIPSKECSVGYGTGTNVNGMKLVATWGGGAFSPEAAARIGQLLLHKGSWHGRQLLSTSVVETATQNAGLPNDSGLGWWVNRELDGRTHWKAAPRDPFWGAGAGHQFLLVVPSLQLVVVRFGDVLDRTVGFDDALEKHLVAPLMGAFSSPSSPGLPRRASFGMRGTVIIGR